MLFSMLFFSACTQESSQFPPYNKEKKKREAAGQKETKKIIFKKGDTRMSIEDYFSLSNPGVDIHNLTQAEYQSIYTVYVEHDLRQAFSGGYLIKTNNYIQIPEYFSEDGSWRYIRFYNENARNDVILADEDE